MSEPNKLASRSGFRLYLSAMVTFALINVNWRHPVFGWSEPISGACIQAVVWSLPWLALVGVIRQPKLLPKVLGLLSLLPLLLFSLLALPWSIGDVQTVLKYGKDLEFEPVSQIDVADGSMLVTYLTNCGLACGPVAVLRHERTIVGPLKIVRIITGHDGETLRVRLIDDRDVMVEDDHFMLRHLVIF